MSITHLVMHAAASYLAEGDNDSLLIFERRTEDALGHADSRDEKMMLIDSAKREIRAHAEGSPERLQILLAFMNRQRLVIRGELS